MVKTPIKIVLLIFSSPLILLLLTQQLWVSSVANILLERKFSEIIQYVGKRNTTLDRMITHQLQSLNFSCDTHDQQLIRDQQFYNNYVRVIGIQTAQGKNCSTIGYPIDFPIDHSVTKPMGFEVLATLETHNTSPEMLIQYTAPKGRVSWVIDSSWAQEQLNQPCNNCFYLSFQFLAPTLNKLGFQRGNKEILSQPTQLSMQRTSGLPPFHSQYTLLAGEELHAFTRQQMLIWGIPLSLLFGLLCSAGYLVVRNYQNSIEGLIEKGIKKQEFIPFYQPIVNSNTQQIMGYEVLLRWQRGQQLVMPNLFIAAAENSGLIIPITQQLIAQVCRDLTVIPTPRWVSINIVAEHLEQHHLSRLLQELDWPHHQRLKFEITERTPIKAIHLAEKEVCSLLEKGYEFTLDDFGTGYGGFSYLQNLHISSIKIDKMFVDTINTKDLKISVLDSIIASAKQSDIEIIAEGVEAQHQIDYLAERGVSLIQGFFYAKPMPLVEALALKVTK